ncbi:MAG: gluconate 2-dehydrogenase subunit 3 family protein [Acidobacteria bacterium]|nr:gluconate 2-dehydrogenase subunit 3 family protein [Acidobacteriota bacterium]
MDQPRNPRRRKFLRAATSAAAGGTLMSCGAAKSPWRTLSALEAATAAAICDRIIPPEEFPGAAAAGAVEYLDRQLAGHFKKLRTAYTRGLAGVDRDAQALFGAPFAKLTAGQQDQVLQALEKQDSSRAFFAMIVSHTMQSYYGDPRHGGNRDGAGWRSIGYDSTIVRGRQ